MSAVDLALELLIDTDVLHHRQVIVAVLEVLVLKALLLHFLHMLQIEPQVLLFHVSLLLLQHALSIHFSFSFLFELPAKVLGAIVLLAAAGDVLRGTG